MTEREAPPDRDEHEPDVQPDGDDEPEQDESRFDIQEVFKPTKLRLGRVPRLVGAAVRLTWTSSHREFLLMAGLQVASSSGAAAQILASKDALAQVLAAGGTGRGLASALPQLLVLAGISVVVGLLATLQTERSRLLTETVSRAAEQRVFDVATAVDLEAFETPAFYDRLQRASIEARFRPSQMSTGLVGIASGVVGAAGIAVALFTLQPLLAPFVIVAYVPLWMVRHALSLRQYEFEWQFAPVARERAYLTRVLTGRDEAKEVRAFGLAGFLRDRYDRLYREYLAGLRKLLRRRTRMTLGANLATAVLTAGTLALLVQLYLSGRMTVATAAAAAAGVQMLSGRLRGLVQGAAALHECAVFLEDYTSFLELAPEPGPQPDAALPPFRRLAAEGVSFTYPGSRRPALDDVTLQIGADEIVALVGENGSGKTTMAKLLCGLYRPTLGRILWDEADTAHIDRRAMRPRIAIIFQDFVRFAFPARENVGAGDTARIDDLDAVRGAARHAGADEFLSRLPKGYETILSKEFKGGRDLSVGQWQRVALARAFMRDAPFIILDEPTAALDARAEHELFQSIRTLCRGRSVLLISHRFSTVRTADRIYVLREGRVIEHGTHGELMRVGGLYAELFTLQAGAYLEPLEAP